MSLDEILQDRLSPDIYCLVHNKIVNLKKENQELKQKYEMQKDSNKLLCKAITCDDCNCKVCEAHKENIKLKKQLEEVEEENFNLRENIYIEKMSFPSEGRNIKELIEMPTYEELQQENEKNKHYKTLYQSLKKQKEELIKWLRDGFSYDTGVVDEHFIEAIENVLNKMEELEGVNDEN